MPVGGLRPVLCFDHRLQRDVVLHPKGGVFPFALTDSDQGLVWGRQRGLVLGWGEYPNVTALSLFPFPITFGVRTQLGGDWVPPREQGVITQDGSGYAAATNNSKFPAAYKPRGGCSPSPHAHHTAAGALLQHPHLRARLPGVTGGPWRHVEDSNYMLCPGSHSLSPPTAQT